MEKEGAVRNEELKDLRNKALEVSEKYSPNLNELQRVVIDRNTTIYVKKDADTIKWLNDQTVPILCTPYLENEVVHNEAVGEIGHNWADTIKISNNASIEEIEAILEKLENKK